MQLMAKRAAPNAFWAELLRQLEARGWSQAKLARELGVHTTTVNRWQTGAPSLDNLRQLSELLKVPLSTWDGASGPVLRAAQQAGLPSEGAVQLAQATLEAFLRARGHMAGTSHAPGASPSKGVTTMTGADGGLLESRVWQSLTREQQMGLALLVQGRDVEDWRIRAALSVLGLDDPSGVHVVTKP